VSDKAMDKIYKMLKRLAYVRK